MPTRGIQPFRSALACETRRKLAVRLAALLFALVVCAPGAVVRASTQPPSEPAAAGRADATGAHETPGSSEAKHGGGLVDVIARVVNFAILAGTLVYLLRSPLATYIADRGTQIRRDLVDAAQMKESAARQIEEIDRKMAALPRELDALREQGAQEIEAEEARIRAAAAAERGRLLEQARREIELQVKVAERELVAHAADLAVGVAADRIASSITDEDQRRLVDRYVSQLRA